MHPSLVKGETLTEFFRCQIDRALAHQRLGALDLTRYYLVQLLAARARADAPGVHCDEPLALWYARATEAGGTRQRTEMRDFADHALFLSGFFSDSLCRTLIDVQYCASLGGGAYQYLGGLSSDRLAPAYAELGTRFLAFADVLTEVSEQAGTTSDKDLLRLYERWLSYGSQRNAQRLARRGLTPTLGSRQAARRVQ